MNNNFIGCIVICIGLSGCHGEIDTSNEGASADNVTSNASAILITGEENMTHANETRPLVKTAIEDLAKRLEIPPSEIQVVRVESVTWRDGSLGCPKTDMMYTQALVDGLLIVLRVGKTNYHYHSGKERPPFLCENPEKLAAKPALD
jgi:hypothetical protein